MSLVAGMVIGAVTTYVYKDDSAKSWLSDKGNKIKTGAGSLLSVFKKKPDDVDVETETHTGEDIESSMDKIDEEVVEASKTTIEDEAKPKK